MAANVRRTAEGRRLAEANARTANWKRWGPYLSERQWGTVREDYSADGDAGTTSRTITPAAGPTAGARTACWASADRECRLCFALALWNGSDPILKERLFGLTGPEGNHGEDVKECYFYLDATPTHSYLKALYKYPQAAFPYERLRRGEPPPRPDRAGIRADRHRRLRRRPLLRRLRRVRQGGAGRHPDPHHGRQSRPGGGARCTCCRRSGSATPGRGAATHEGCGLKPRIELAGPTARCAPSTRRSGKFRFVAGPAPDGAAPTLLFTENETNAERLFERRRTPAPYVKDAFHDYVVDGQTDAVNPERRRHQGGGALSCSTCRPAARSIVRLRLLRRGAKRRAAVRRRLRRSLRRAHRARPTSSTTAACPRACRDEDAAVARQAYAGPALDASSSTTTSSSDWLRRRSRPAAAAAERASRAATATGGTSTTATSSRCPTSGSIPGTPPGTWRST